MKTRTIKTVIMNSLLLSIVASVQAADTTYVWTTADGNPSDMTGTIVLNSSSSANGTFSDIVSITVSDPTSGTYNADLATDNFDFTAPFTWNPTKITAMDIEVATGAQVPAPPGGHDFVVSDGQLFDDQNSISDDGSWLAQGRGTQASAPDGGPTLGLLVIAGVGLVFARKQLRAA